MPQVSTTGNDKVIKYLSKSAVSIILNLEKELVQLGMALIALARNTNLTGRFSTVDLLIKLAYFVKSK
jgi:hypothetical protein